MTLVDREFPAQAGAVKVWAETGTPGVLQMTCRSLTAPALIPPEEYGRLLDIQKKLSHPGRRTVILKKSR